MIHKIKPGAIDEQLRYLGIVLGESIMLAVFFCNAEICRKIHVRTDERKINEQIFCPKCGSDLTFVCDYLSWTGSYGGRRHFTLDEQMKVKLKIENEKLKGMAEVYQKNYSSWKEKGIVFHDALWQILTSCEPDKFQRTE